MAPINIYIYIYIYIYIKHAKFSFSILKNKPDASTDVATRVSYTVLNAQFDVGCWY